MVEQIVKEPGGPLAGLRVLDITMNIAGPWCTKLLADAGADVVKVEPLSGDGTRRMPAVVDGRSSYFHQANAGKRCVSLDLKHPMVLSLVDRLIGNADVVVENLRPTAALRCGITWDRIRALNPRSIFCSISGYGLTGSRVERPGQDVAVQCLTGIALQTRTSDGTPAFPPWSLSDTYTGTIAYLAILDAIRESRNRAVGKHVAIRMDRCVAQFHDAPPWVMRQPDTAVGWGSHHPFFVPRGILRASDGSVAYSAYRVTHWRKFSTILGESFSTNEYESVEYRYANRKSIIDATLTYFAGKTTEQIGEVLSNLGIPFTACRDLVSIPHDDNLLRRRSLARIQHSSRWGNLFTSVLHKEHAREHLGAPFRDIGSDTLDICREYGISASDISDLVIADAIRIREDQMSAIFDDLAN